MASFSEKNQRDRNIIKEYIEKYEIPTVRIPAIKKGEDFIAPDGTVIKNEDITFPPPEPLNHMHTAAIQNTSSGWLALSET